MRFGSPSPVVSGPSCAPILRHVIVAAGQLSARLQRPSRASRSRRHADLVAAPASAAPIPEARFDDLDLDREDDRVEWRRRLEELAAARLSSARARLERLGIVDAEGKLVSTELPPDMLPDADTTLETG
jgi:hypothetical protein